MCCLQLSISVRSRTYHHSWFLSAYSPGISEGICIQIILRCFCYVMMKQKNVIKYVRTWTCSSVLYLLLRAVYLNQIPFFSSTFISTLVPGGFTDGNIIALSSMFLPAIFTFIGLLIFEEITTKTSVRLKKSL